MCGRYASARPVDDLATAFGIGDGDVEAVAPADWNVAPTKPVTAVVDRGDHRVLTVLRWGLVPHWADDPSIGARLINARLETAWDKPAFRDALAHRRCLLPADGWYEWQARPDGVRQPHFLTRPDGDVLALAGLWETWYDADGQLLATTTILTGPAPHDLAVVHDRAPVVLTPADWDSWLDPDSSRAEVVAVLRPTAAGVVAAHPVRDDVGDVRTNGPQLTERIDVAEQPPLF